MSKQTRHDFTRREALLAAGTIAAGAALASVSAGAQAASPDSAGGRKAGVEY